MTVFGPTPPVSAIGTIEFTKRVKAADVISAFLVSRPVSLYSGAKVAAASGAVDQIMTQIQTIAIWRPPQAMPGSLSLKVRFEVVKSPFRNGRNVKQKSGNMSRIPAR